MIDLKEIYDKLPLPQNQNANTYSANAIKGYKNHRIAKNYADNPSLLIFVSEHNQDFGIANQNLFNIKISHNQKCEIEANNKTIQKHFSVISYTGHNSDVKDIFLSTCQVLIQSLGQTPSNRKIKFVVSKFIELFKSLQETPQKSLQGLWAELFLIEQSLIPEKIIDGWHIIPEEKFDFSFGKLRIEMKSSGSEYRTHFFNSTQLNPVHNTEIIIASVLVNINSGGTSLMELLERLNNKLNDYPSQKEKLHLLVYSILGTDSDKINQTKFDYQLAIESLRFYHSSEVPKINNINIPNEVSNVKFISDLTNSKYIDTNVDELIKQHIED